MIVHAQSDMVLALLEGTTAIRDVPYTTNSRLESRYEGKLLVEMLTLDTTTGRTKP